MQRTGFQLVELLVVASLASILFLLTAPPLLRITARLRLEMAAAEIVGVLHSARSYAVRHHAKVAVRFRETESGGVEFALFRDGNGDGVRSRDIETGRDPRVTPFQRLARFDGRVRFGFPPHLVPTDPGSAGRLLERLDDPIRFNRSDMASFTPFGGATPGSLYLTDGRRQLMVVRVANRSGRIRLLRYDPRAGRWAR